MAPKLVDSFSTMNGTAPQDSNMLHGSYNIFPVTEQSPVPNPGQQGLNAANHNQTQQYFQFPRTQAQHVRKGSMDSLQAQQRRGSLLNPAARNLRALAPSGRVMEGANIFGHNESHNATTFPVSAFDMAPLPHPHMVGLSSLVMEGSPESDLEESYYTHSPGVNMSPGFPPQDVQQQLTLYENAMHPVPNMGSSPVLAPQGAGNVRPMLLPAPVPNETIPIERRGGEINNSGITMEEIASFIAGPESTDGKWVCLYDGCAKRFGRKENIKSHVQTHLGDRQFKCQVCKKCFVRQHDLKRHSKIHTGVKPYPCLCGNSFARHDALTRHRQRGMCIGAFEGVVRKEVKRGRPRKKPLPKDEPVSSGNSTSGASDASSSAKGTPPPGQEDTTSSHVSSNPTTPSRDVESPTMIHEMGSSDEYSPPTSPGYDVDSFGVAEKVIMNGFASESSLHHMARGVSPEDYGHIRKTMAYHTPTGFHHVDMSMFSDLGLTTLERDPSILSFEDGFVKPELMDAERTFFNGE